MKTTTDAADSAIIADMLRCFGQTRDVVDIAFPPGGFSGAVVVHAQSPAGEFCLRGWPVNTLPRQRICGLHRLLQHVYQQGVTCVAVPFESETGDTLVWRHGRYWQLEPWLPGTADYWSNPNENRLRAAARRLAEWHQAAATFTPDNNSDVWFAGQHQAESPAIGERLQRLRQLQRSGYRRLRQSLPANSQVEFHDIGRQILDMFPRAATVVEGELSLALQSRFDLQPCLRDVWHDHILFRGDEVTGLIDASACRCENVATDLARLFGSLIEDDRQAWDIALGEYQRHARLSLDELALVHVLDRSGILLAGMTWLWRCYIDGEPVAKDHRVVSRMKTIFQRLARLI